MAYDPNDPYNSISQWSAKLAALPPEARPTLRSAGQSSQFGESGQSAGSSEPKGTQANPWQWDEIEDAIANGKVSPDNNYVKERPLSASTTGSAAGPTQSARWHADDALAAAVEKGRGRVGTFQPQTVAPAPSRISALKRLGWGQS